MLVPCLQAVSCSSFEGPLRKSKKSLRMAWFRAFRNEYGFSWYGDNRTPVTFDFPLVTVTYLCAVLGVATLISTLGIRGRERWATTLRASYAVGIASIILVCLVGHDWLVGQTEVKTHYLYRSDNYFRGSVGLRIALHGCNVTLEGYYSGVNGEGHVYYAESMKWRDYGKEQETITPYLEKGLPHPVLTVLDFLSADGGGFRWGRNFHASGYFGCALLWTALAFWLISNVLLLSVVSYGAFMFFLTGVAMVLCCVVYHVCQPPHPLHVHFGDSLLTTSYGWCFWLTLASGILTLVLGAALFVCDHIFHEKVSEFFNLDKLDEDDVPDQGPYTTSVDPAAKDRSGSLPTSLIPPNSGSRRGSFQHQQHLKPQDLRRVSLPPPQSVIGAGPSPSLGGPQQQPRRHSIFLEPERRPSDHSLRRGSPLFSGVGGFTNRGFEQERPLVKTNPLFNANVAGSGSAGGNIMEEGGERLGDPHRLTEVRVEVEMEREGESRSGLGYSNRKPSLATMREHHENHLNQQRQSGSEEAVTTCTAVVIEPPSDDNDYDNNGKDEADPRSQHARDEEEGGGMDGGRRGVTDEGGSGVLGKGKKGAVEGEEDEHKGHESGSDSAIASWTPSPEDSEKNSTCGECEDSSAHL